MKNIIFLVIFIAAIAVIIALNLGSKTEPEPVVPKEPILIAKPTDSDAKPAKVVLPDSKVDKKDQVSSKTVEHKVETTNNDIRKEVKKAVGEIKNGIEEINQELSAPKGHDQNRLMAKENSDLKELDKNQGTVDISQMSIAQLDSLLAKPGKENDRVEALNALGDKKTEAKGSLGNVLSVMASGSDLERAYAAKAVGNITQDDKDSLAKLMATLKNDKDENVRKEAARSIGEFKLDQEQVKDLDTIMLAEKNERVKSKIQITINKSNLKN